MQYDKHSSGCCKRDTGMRKENRHPMVQMSACNSKPYNTNLQVHTGSYLMQQRAQLSSTKKDLAKLFSPACDSDDAITQCHKLCAEQRPFKRTAQKHRHRGKALKSTDLPPSREPKVWNPWKPSLVIFSRRCVGELPDCRDVMRSTRYIRLPLGSLCRIHARLCIA